jgi:hypothetical protein
MKKLMIVIAIVSTAIGAYAQKPVTIPKPGSGIIKVDPKANPKITTKWLLDVKKMPLNDKAYIKDLTANLIIRLEVKDEVNFGKTLCFYSTMPISRIELTYGTMVGSRSLGANIKTDCFYLESATYKSGLKTGYKLLFYMKGIEVPVAEGEAIPLTVVN